MAKKPLKTESGLQQDTLQGEKKKYRQSKHKNVFKNFGQALYKFIFGNQQYKKLIEERLSTAAKVKRFNEWIKSDIKLERKLDFARGLTKLPGENEERAAFRVLLKDLSLKFFEEDAQIYIENSRKLENHEIHIRSIPTFIEGIRNPVALARFKPKVI